MGTLDVPHDQVVDLFHRYQSQKSKPPVLWRELTATYHGDVDTGECRFDVVTGTILAGHQLRLHGYEVKGTRPDFQSDMRSEKWRKYLATGVHQVSYAAPRGLIDPDEIPDGIGLVVWNPDKETWRHVRKAPKIHDGQPPDGLMVRLLLRKHEETVAWHPRRQQTLTREERVERYLATENAAQIVTGRVREQITNLIRAERDLDARETNLARRETELEQREAVFAEFTPRLAALAELFDYLRRASQPNAVGTRDETDHDFLEAVRTILPTSRYRQW